MLESSITATLSYIISDKIMSSLFPFKNTSVKYVCISLQRKRKPYKQIIGNLRDFFKKKLLSFSYCDNISLNQNLKIYIFIHDTHSRYLSKLSLVFVWQSATIMKHPVSTKLTTTLVNGQEDLLIIALLLLTHSVQKKRLI